MDILLQLTSRTLKYTGVEVSNPHTVSIPKGVTAIIGRNGSGKTSLAKIIERGRNFMTNSIVAPDGSAQHAKLVTFTDIHTLSGFKVDYFQQRFESSMNDDVPTVELLMGEKMHTSTWIDFASRFRLNDIANKKINFLSSGELRKLLLINALTDLPDILILDNPYIGLDKQSRSAVEEAILDISRRGISVLLLVCDPNDIPSYADAVLPMAEMEIGQIVLCDSPADVDNARELAWALFDCSIPRLPSFSTKQSGDGNTDAIVKMHGCEVRYGQRVLLLDVDWTINRGESWALSGPNGCGKSTLLSLINADNPQAYANDIELFGRKRGSGESIWDIKSRIGFLSSEMHLCFNAFADTVESVLESGCKTALRRYEPISEVERSRIDAWLEYFGLGDLAAERFSQLSFGQQRLVLLIRSLLQQPELLILDEPEHGLDAAVKAKVRHMIERLASMGTTLIYVTHNAEELPQCITHHKSLTPH